jgi:macrodomain Ter protein organizer (MatP/YcbG family)
VEDLHYQPVVDDVLDTRGMLRAWKNGDAISTKYIDKTNARRIVEELASVDFYDSLSLRWPSENIRGALAVLRKRI